MKLNVPLLGRTETGVHTEETMLRQRDMAAGREISALNGLALYGQLMIGLSLYLYDHVGTPSYISILLLLPFLATIIFLERWLLRKADGENLLISCAGKRGGRMLAVLLALIGWLDGQLAFYALCAMVSNILPTISSFQVALAIGITVAFALGGRGAAGLSRLSRLMGWLIFLGIAYCALMALPYGNSGYLFPLLGHGSGRIIRGSLWMSGCGAGACMPLFLPAEKRENRRILGHAPILRSLLIALGFAAATAVLSAYLLPVYALSRPETLGYRLLLLARVNPSVAVWSLLVCAMMFLMLMTLGAGAQHSGQFFSLAAGKRKISLSLTAGILLSYVPLGALNIQPLENFLLQLAPWRAGLLLMVLLALCVGYRMKKRKNAPAREAHS